MACSNRPDDARPVPGQVLHRASIRGGYRPSSCRGGRTRTGGPRPAGASTFAESSCVSCGACVDTCPSGALEDKSVLTLGISTHWTRTTCPYCGTGCELQVGTRDGRLTQVLPVNDAPVSRGHLCVKGRYAFDFAASTDRVTEPLVRTGGQWRAVSWDEAIDVVVARLRQVIDRHGPESVGVLGSARATNEDNYLAQKFARVVVGTNNVDCCARVCHTPSAAALKTMLGTGASTNAFDASRSPERSSSAVRTPPRTILSSARGSNRRRGAHLIVIDPRAIELARYADIHLALKPGTNVPVPNAMAHTIVTEGLYDEAFVQARVEKWDHNAGTMTRRSQTDQFRPTDVLELSPADAARLDITEGDWVTLKSRYGEATLPALRAPWLKAGELFATFHDPSVFLNKITGRHRDAIVGAPEYNVTAVRLDKPGDVLHGTAIADGGPE